MKKMNKKGFTLIELLTVIAILAVILLIAAPTILGVLDKARKNTFKNQVLLYVEAVKTQMALTAMGEGYSQITGGVATPDATTTTVSVNVADLNAVMDSAKLTSGTIKAVYDGGNIVYKVNAVTDGSTYTTPAADTLVTALTEQNITKYVSSNS